MLHLPDIIMRVLRPFAQAFSERIWDWAQVLVIGAILTPGKRTVIAILRSMGLSDEVPFQNYHRVLNRAKWSGLRRSQILLGLLVAAFVAIGARWSLPRMRRWSGATASRSSRRAPSAMRCARVSATP